MLEPENHSNEYSPYDDGIDIKFAFAVDNEVFWIFSIPKSAIESNSGFSEMLKAGLLSNPVCIPVPKGMPVSQGMIWNGTEFTLQ